MVEGHLYKMKNKRLTKQIFSYLENRKIKNKMVPRDRERS